MAWRNYPTLAKAPIVEALVDFRVSGISDRPLDGLRKLCEEIAADYPQYAELYELTTEVRVQPDAGQTPRPQSRRHIGFRLNSADGAHVATFTCDGFTVSRLRPYDTWASLRGEANTLWTRYLDAVNPTSISRVALRYINRLELPPHLRDFRDYLTAPPEVPPRLPQFLDGFLTRITIPLPHVDGHAIVTQKLEPRRDDAASVVILLDIDVFKMVQLPASGHEAWKLTDQLRNEKNMIFFESITEQMEDLCT